MKLVIFDCDGVLVDSEGPVNSLLLDDLIAAIEDIGASIWVASNGPTQKMRHTLIPHGLWDRFEGRIMSREDFAPKPAPDMILHAMACEGAAPVETVFIDDSPSGCGAGIAAGVRTLGFAHETPAAVLAGAGAEPVASMKDIRRLLGL